MPSPLVVKPPNNLPLGTWSFVGTFVLCLALGRLCSSTILFAFSTSDSVGVSQDARSLASSAVAAQGKPAACKQGKESACWHGKEAAVKQGKAFAVVFVVVDWSVKSNVTFFVLVLVVSSSVGGSCSSKSTV